MAVFNELIKNYERIRDYIRDFLVYGYKHRNDYSMKSSRSYDNEKRRIESYLSDYIQYENSTRGKKMFITADTIEMEQNPLFKTWMTKSFTRNDIMLHFMILDTLRKYSGLSVNELTDVINTTYFSQVEINKIPDTMTIRNKLKEYNKIGYIYSEKKGKTLYYSITPSLLNTMSTEAILGLHIACGYFQNIVPMGVLGCFIRQKLKDTLESEIFSFRHLYIAHTLDDEVLLSILLAIRNKKTIEIETHYRRSDRKVQLHIAPLKIINNVSLGRRYVAGYNYYQKKYATYRIDNIKKVKIFPHETNTVVHNEKLNNLLSQCWSVSLSKDKQLETVILTLYIDEEKEDYIIDRIHREGKHGTLIKITNNTYKYDIQVLDANEMVPWLRTFIGRMISFECSNKYVESRFLKDIYDMIALYGG